MQRCCRCLVRRALSEGDGSYERQRKALWVPLQSVLVALSLLYVGVEGSNVPRADAIGFIMCLATTSVALAYPLATRALPQRFVGVILVLLCVAVILLDHRSAAGLQSFRSWTWVVLIMDVCLALNVQTVYQRSILMCTSLWIVVFSMEGAYRLGLYDVEWYVGTGAQDMCGCASPPCGEGFIGMVRMLPTLTVLYGDYFATRGFADGLRSEQDRMLASIKTAEQVAASLAGFDLHAAERALEEAGDSLPEGHDRSLRRLLRNLASYRPYLPHTCFMRTGDDGEDLSDGLSASNQGPGGTPAYQELSCVATLEGTPAEAAIMEGAAPPRGGAPAQLRSPMVRRASGAAAARNVGAPRRASGASSATVSSAGEPLAVSPKSSAAASEVPSLRPARSQHTPQLRRVALLVRNSKAFLAAPRLGADSAAVWLAEQVEFFTAVVQGQGGAADLLSGDHLSASFGAVKAQGSRAASAARAAAALTAPPEGPGALGPLQHTAAVCGGRALCGDFGSSACMRFMVIGAVSSFCPLVERAAAAWGLAVLVDAAVHADAEHLWSCRLRQMVRFLKLTAAPIALWELLVERVDCEAANEWMYALESAASNPWEGYNLALQSLFSGDTKRALVLCDKHLGQIEGAGGSEAAEGLLALRALAQDGTTPSPRDFSTTALVGDPMPLRPQGPAAHHGEQLS